MYYKPKYPFDIPDAILDQIDHREYIGMDCFGQITAKDRFEIIAGVHDNFCDPFDFNWDKKRFDINPREFLSKAKYKKCTPGNTVSLFSDWVHSLYARPGDEHLKKLGLVKERSIFKARKLLLESKFIAVIPKNDWSLIHNGLHICREENFAFSNKFTIPALVVNERPLTASPDLVFINNTNGEIIIVEIKYSNNFIPSNLWPNVWAQLWAYSHIPDFKDAPKIVVVGEVWGDNLFVTKYFNSLRKVEIKQCESFEAYLRASVRRNPRDERFHNFFSKLFDIYSSRFTGRISPTRDIF